MKKAEVEELQETIREQGEALGRFASDNSRLRVESRKNYESRRRLENAIRRHATKQCACKSQRECLLALGRLVPKAARPPYKKRIKAS